MKAMISNISDIAAMGGIPEYAMVSMALPSDINVEFVESVYRGMRHAADKYGIDIIGGDTGSAPLIIINIACKQIKITHRVRHPSLRISCQAVKNALLIPTRIFLPRLCSISSSSDKGK